MATPLIDGVLTFSPGTKTIVLGHNGAGKPVIRICHGLMGPDSGSVAWAERVRGTGTAVVFRNPSSPTLCTVECDLWTEVNGVPKLRRQEIAEII